MLIRAKNIFFGLRAHIRDCLGCKSGALQMLSYIHVHTYIYTYMQGAAFEPSNIVQTVEISFSCKYVCTFSITLSLQ